MTTPESSARGEAVIAAHPPNDGREWDCSCARCGSSVDWEDCTNCDDGYDGHDCGEDCCCCADPEPNVVCHYCHGRGGWNGCMSSATWCQGNPLPGRENVKRGELEWYVLSAPHPQPGEKA